MQQTGIMNAWNKRGSDSEKFVTRISGIRVVVEKIWLKEFLGAKLEYWKNSRAIYVYTESRKGVCVKKKGQNVIWTK
jgi:hypothetical protein